MGEGSLTHHLDVSTSLEQLQNGYSALKYTENIDEKTAQGIDNPMVSSMRAAIPEEVYERVLREVFLKRLFSVEEASVYLGKGTDAVRQMIYSRQIKVVQRGERGKVYIDRLDLDSWIENEKRFSGEKPKWRQVIADERAWGKITAQRAAGHCRITGKKHD